MTLHRGASRFSGADERFERGSRRETHYFIMEEEVMIEVTEKAAGKIKDFLQTQQGPGTVRILLQSC